MLFIVRTEIDRRHPLEEDPRQTDDGGSGGSIDKPRVRPSLGRCSGSKCVVTTAFSYIVRVTW